MECPNCEREGFNRIAVSRDWLGPFEILKCDHCGEEWKSDISENEFHAAVIESGD